MSLRHPDENQPRALEVLGATKVFGATVALDRVNLHLGPGEIRALMGANGSGKSTLIKALSGYHTLDDGDIRVRGVKLDLHRLGEEAKAHGLRFVHQDLALIPTLTVAENLALDRGYVTGRFGSIQKRRQLEWARQRLDTVGRGIDPRSEVASLGPVERTLVAVTRALDEVDPTRNLLLLDEPTARLPQADSRRLIDTLVRLRDVGLPVVYVTHRLEEVYALADTITVLRDGEEVFEGAVKDLPMQALRSLITGTEPARRRDRASDEALPVSERPPALEIRHLSTDRLFDIDLVVSAGEVVAITGLIGSGRSELGRAVYGLQPFSSGTISIAGKQTTAPVSDAVKMSHVGYTPQERSSGLLAGLPVVDNLLISSFEGTQNWAGIVKRLALKMARGVIADLNVSPSNPHAKISDLSGGNQQKVSLGKWVRLSLALLILDEPTQSIDVGAKAELLTAIRERAVREGLGVVWLDSDVEEIVKYADRILVMSDGRIVREFSHRPFASVEVLAAVYGHLAAGPAS